MREKETSLKKPDSSNPLHSHPQSIGKLAPATARTRGGPTEERRRAPWAVAASSPPRGPLLRHRGRSSGGARIRRWRAQPPSPMAHRSILHGTATLRSRGDGGASTHRSFLCSLPWIWRTVTSVGDLLPSFTPRRWGMEAAELVGVDELLRPRAPTASLPLLRVTPESAAPGLCAAPKCIARGRRRWVWFGGVAGR
jgi:hypothetical protein